MTLAHAAGADLADLEFLQFHPTAVKGIKGREGFLVTEAIRGEGATLHGPDGERFVEELAPRDEVARAIVRRHAGDRRAVRRPRHAPTSTRPASRTSSPRCSEAGLDPTKAADPRLPRLALHDGRDRHRPDGRSTVPGLYAVGETACTGLHGANRLASNSLSECFVFGARAATAGLDEDDPGAPPTDVQPPPGPGPCSSRSEPRRTRSGATPGSVRTREGLERLLDDPHPLARLIATCALLREESRGAHQRADFPAVDDRARPSPRRRRRRRQPRLARWE